MQATVTLATIPAIVALVNFGKEVGLPQRFALALAVVLGIVLAVADFALGAFPAYQAAAAGLMLGLAAAGLYDLTGRAAPMQQTWNVRMVAEPDAPDGYVPEAQSAEIGDAGEDSLAAAFDAATAAVGEGVVPTPVPAPDVPGSRTIG